ncbi:AraC family transcriptional regulator [Cohnella lupini]|uniref:AraC-like DNA-binding protein n=1 Tax=Cohnella lupini TaxID=1294267 RepID=A0A3D9ITA2_9BACL|nr:AraC family transcriptional regulator [Cohnella lupini]RED64877.1 AraC-like DNA-binding protein [Cohnella lupini]
MNNSYSRYFVTTEWDRGLPLHLTSVGCLGHQTAINREHGYNGFHWLHTVEGCGEFTVNGTTVKLNPNQGILLKPNVPHSYFPETAVWSTWYMTFDGALSTPITASLDIPQMTPLSWETDCPLANIHEQYNEKCGYSFDFAGINGSLEVYSFLAQIKRYGQISGQPSLSKGHERLTPIYLLIEEQYGDAALGLGRMAETLGVSPQYLNTLFRKSWGISPYQYLVQFRVQKSKELLLANRNRTVKEISQAVGFQDDSHFVHTFRKLAGATPTQFRLQYGE